MARFRKKLTSIAIGVMGQSNEQGQVSLTELLTFPQAFASLENPEGCTVPLAPATQVLGSWWPNVYDNLRDYGYETTIVNGALGSLSFVTQACGYRQFWNSATGYVRQRVAPIGNIDNGYFGDTIISGSKVFLCTGGRDLYALNGPPFFAPGTGQVYLDFLNFIGAQVSGASQPTAGFTAANLGDTVADQDLTWTCVATNNQGFTSGAVFTEGGAGYGFDPLGVLQRLHVAMQRVKADRKIIYFQNGQGDTSQSTARYAAALVSMANFFLTRGYEVMIGFTCYSARSNNVAVYNTLQAGVVSALATLQAGSYGAKVYAGANLYSLMGTTGPMGGSSFTGAIASNVLTVSASSFGAIAIGQRLTVSGGGALLGTVASLGTGTGGVGTYNLTGGVDTASTTLWSAGEFFQITSGNANIHLNGAGSVGPAINGVSCAGKYISDAFKAVLADRRPLVI